MAETVEIIVGTIGRAHGIRGDATIEVRTDEASRRFVVGGALRTEGGRALTIRQVRWHQGRLLLAFEGVPDRTAVEALRGETLLMDVPTDEVPSEPEEYFDRQLVGLQVLAADGIEAGQVVQVEHFPAQDLLIVETPDGERMIPFVTELVPVVDLEAGHIRLADVPGLLEDLE